MGRRPAVLAALVATALAATATAVPATAVAQEPGEGASKPAGISAGDRAVARRHFMRGKELHAAGNYREAATEYLAAYDRFPAPAFLYNVAQVYRLAGDKKNALANYRKYLELEPEGEGSADAREFISALEAEIAAESSSPTTRAKSPPPATDSNARPDPIDPIQPIDQVDSASRGKPGRGKKIAGITIGAAGVVGLGVAVAFGLKARSADNELSGYMGPWSDNQQATYDDGKSAQRTAIIGAAIGSAAVVTGVVLYVLGSRDARRAAERRARTMVDLGAAPTRDGALIVVGGAF
jgi:tetratricopeptide (TPR) repeat protein